MKISGRVDGSVRGAVLNRPSTTFRNVQPPRRTLCRAVEITTETTTRRIKEPPPCSRSSIWLLSTFTPEVHRTPRGQQQFSRRSYSTASEAASSTAKSLPYSRLLSNDQEKRHLMSFVGDRGEGSVQEHFDFHRDPYRRGYAQPDGPNVQVSDKKHDVEYPTREETFKINDEVQTQISKLYAAIGQRLRHPNRITLEAIYKLYLLLPEPRMLYLTWHWRNRLLKVMGTPPKRDMESMLRYFALVADVKNAGLTLRRTQWNFALAFATKYASRPSAHEMESALRLWREMEKEANVLGNDVTFNVLFDVAAKTGNFTLADMIYKEMESRGFEFNRFHHVSLIHYFGLRLDSGGVRAAYKEMVDSGEMIDTIVLNCVISGLLRCGEEAAADDTYEQMKNANNLSSDMPQRDYMMNKVVTRVLMMFSKVGKQHPQLKDSLQTNIRLAPDLHTYKLLIQHYAIRVGNLAKVARYLDEMKYLKISAHPTVFLALFKGFYLHGGFPGSDWSEQRLNGVLTSLYEAKDSHREAFRIEQWLVIWALRAVKKCSSNEAVVKTFDALAQRWDIKGERQQFLHGTVENILQDKETKSLLVN
ncbi:pentatricopeptide repeat protein [Pochonia chlamydosporia 170]|uniref:Pentatricopeptide repeat protein n=1 Tax=Pochonia chlamydosporia 170 TaxID=1380566 RepID=A0A179FWY5_METCM|nr:pentatricopeptide repeat protein [Pochonia chlamydosporia 170]OAQ69738.1 pentatricopeptide repeat protein [Pochonia chlamydosporia 170]